MFSPGFPFFFQVFFGALCAPVSVFWLLAFRSPLLEASPLRAPIASFFHCHLPQRCSGQIAPEPSPVDHSVFVFVFLWFPCILFPLYFFFFFFAGFPRICFSISLYCFSLFILCFFFVFTILPIFSAPVSPLFVHCRAFFRTPTALSFQRVLQCMGSTCTRSVLFPCIFPFFCL
jgi:hypothetical protein